MPGVHPIADGCGASDHRAVRLERLQHGQEMVPHAAFGDGREGGFAEPTAAMPRTNSDTRIGAVPRQHVVGSQRGHRIAVHHREHDRAALDEAFAGVDENNIRDMFQLVEELDFNYIMNSQALWGDYDTVSKLSIAELVRPKNAPYVTVIRYFWNGAQKQLLYDESELEQLKV